MAEVATQCPHCEKVLKLKSAAMLGKKVACPKCGDSFTIKRYKEPEVVEDEYNYDYQEEDYEEPAEEDEAPARRRSAASSSSKRSRGKTTKKGGGAAKWIAPLLIGVAVVLGLGGVIAGGIYIIPKLGGRNIVDLTYLPAETEMVIHVRFKEIWDAPLLAPLRNNPELKQLIERESPSGVKIELSDLDSMTMGVTNLSEQRRVLPFGGGLGPVVRSSNAKFIGVMRLSKDVTEELVQQMPGSVKETHGGQSIQVGNQGGKSVAVWLASPRSFVFGDPAEVKKAIDRGATETRLRRFDFANAKQQFFMAMAPENPVSNTNTAPGATPDQRLTSSLDKNAKGFCFGLSVTSDIAMQIQINCFNSTGAKAMQSDVDAIIAEAKTKIASAPPNPIPLMQSVVDLGKETVNSISAKQSGSLVTVNARVPAKLGDVVKEAMDNPLVKMAMGAAANQANAANQMQPGITPGIVPPTSTPIALPGASVRLQFNIASVVGSNPTEIAQQVIGGVNPKPAPVRVIQVAGSNVITVEVPADSAVEAIKDAMEKAGFQLVP